MTSACVIIRTNTSLIRELDLVAVTYFVYGAFVSSKCKN